MKYNAPNPQSGKRTTEIPRWASLLIVMAMALSFVGSGIWMIRTGWVGHTPTVELSPQQAKIPMLIGFEFVCGGLAIVVAAIWGARFPPIMARISTSLFLVALGLPAIAIAILDPGGISSSTSINGAFVHVTKGSAVGAVVFLVSGLLCLFGAFWPWRWWKKNRKN